MKSGLPFVMDPREKELLSEDTNMCFKRCCINCGTSKTPLWRGGPTGPKSLCNACGIRYRKKKMSIMGSTKSTEKKRETMQTHGSTAISAMTTTLTTNTSSDTTDISTAKPDNIGSNSDIKDPVKVQFVAFGNEMMLQRSTPVVKKQRCQRKKKLGEEEQAAFLLMALSCGSVFA